MDAEEQVRQALRGLGLPDAVVRHDASTGTAPEAASAVGCELGRIVKTLLFLADDRPTIVLAAGDCLVDTGKLAAILGVRRKRLTMASAEQVLSVTGFTVGGVPPVGLAQPCDVVVDESLRRFDSLWVAAGTGHTVVQLPTAGLVEAVHGQWAAICRSEAR